MTHASQFGISEKDDARLMDEFEQVAQDVQDGDEEQFEEDAAVLAADFENVTGASEEEALEAIANGLASRLGA